MTHEETGRVTGGRSLDLGRREVDAGSDKSVFACFPASKEPRHTGRNSGLIRLTDPRPGWSRSIPAKTRNPTLTSVD
jgi:hypothetical protein